MRVVAITNLFPSHQEPTRAAFNRQQWEALSTRCQLEVLRTVPWCPGFSHWRRVLVPPRHERVVGIDVYTLRTPYVPRLNVLSGPLYLGALLTETARLRGKVDVVMGSWAYPDGWAATLFARALGVPAVVKVHGTDLNRLDSHRGAARMLRAVLPNAAGVIAVSKGLAEHARNLGVPEDRIAIVENGVDGRLFYPRDRNEARAALGRSPQERMILYVGNLIRPKGVFELIEAFRIVGQNDPSATLVLLGDGEQRQACERAAQEIRGITLLGTKPHRDIATWLAACDIHTLPSWNEGTPSAVVEALASGRRSICTAVGGIPDIVHNATLGALVAPHPSPSALASALQDALQSPYDPAEVAAEAAISRGNWQQSAEALYQVLLQAKAGCRQGRSATSIHFCAPRTGRQSNRSASAR